jgi:hypothetical protein
MSNAATESPERQKDNLISLQASLNQAATLSGIYGIFAKSFVLFASGV